MNYPSTYIQQVLMKSLEDWIEKFDENNVKVNHHSQVYYSLQDNY